MSGKAISTEHGAGQAATPSPADDDVAAMPLRHTGRWVAAAALLVVFGGTLASFWRNPNIDHTVVAKYLFDTRILSGVGLTVTLTATSMILATMLAVLLAVMRLSTNPVLRVLSWVYVWFFRGTPLLVQVVFWGYLGLLYSRLSIGIPFTSITFASANTSTIITAFVAGLLALGLNEAAYASEIVRAGLLSVDAGHIEAAYSLGMSPTYTLRRIILPQAMRVIIPPMGNETISMLKNTALLELIAVHELYTRTSQISAQNLSQVELLIVASAWYLAMTTVLSIPQYYLERRFGRGTARRPPTSPWKQIRLRYQAARVRLRTVARTDSGMGSPS
ncbi:amino acid ABC transporter permease [Actinoallomurus bryophytorum]|uniref:Polar amino acid transport system permease protein n=1 Tax=Actinoallomurus bryophytorum TaxID=1490222 RepID=A0A543BTB0_9ACTN|nr:amino acid ABC transporter permease [Actinoallomurus bryophytorum]TQL88073.1 polar amino acid transport system permease protein [Actinoallomurus bryophytorum]